MPPFVRESFEFFPVQDVVRCDPRSLASGPFNNDDNSDAASGILDKMGSRSFLAHGTGSRMCGLYVSG